LAIPWLTHGYALHLKISISGSFCHFSWAERFFSPMAGEKYLSAGEKANHGKKFYTKDDETYKFLCKVMLNLYSSTVYIFVVYHYQCHDNE